MKTCDICDRDLAEQLWRKSEQWTNLEERLTEVQRFNESVNLEKATMSIR